MKRFFAVLMVIILFSAFMKSALASEKRLLLSETEDIERKMNQKAIENEKQINVLLESLVHQRMKELEDGNDKTYSNISKENSSTIELKLKLLGVKSISGKEVNDLVSQYSKNTEKQYAKYVRDEKVKWFTYTTSYLYGGTVYSVKNVIAMGYNEGSMLVNGHEFRFFENSEKLLRGVSEIVSVYIQKAIGMIPHAIFKVTPYELLFSGEKNDKIKSNIVITLDISTIKFSFVKKEGSPDSNYILAKFSNKANISIKALGQCVRNGKISDYYRREAVVEESPGYESFPAIIDAYRGYYPKYDYIPSYTVYSYDKEYKREVFLPNLLTGPGQVY